MQVEQQQGSEQQQQPAEEVVTISKAELDRKFNKARKNAQAETEARIRREYATRGGEQQQQGQQRQQAQQAELKEPERPKRDAFLDYETYLEAREKYIDEKAKYEGTRAARAERERMQQEDSERKAGEERAARDREFGKRAKAVVEEIPDFAETIESAEGVMISDAMGDAIKESPLGPHILYRLVKDANDGGDLAERISKMSATAAAREIGKIEAKIEAEQEAKKKKKGEGEEEEQEEGKQSEQRGEQSGERNEDGRFKAQEKPRKAPEPIEPGTGRSANQDRGPNDKDSDKNWYEKRLAQDRAERERRRK
jgi:hypothetical protein